MTELPTLRRYLPLAAGVVLTVAETQRIVAKEASRSEEGKIRQDVRSGGSRRSLGSVLTAVAVLVLGLTPYIASPLAAAAKVPTLLTASSAPLASSAQTTRQISLGLTTFGRIVVDPASSHVFVSSPGSNAIAATDLSGNNLKTLPVAGGPAGMAVLNGTLFVALSTGGAIEKIDPVSLTDKGALATGLTQPQELVVAGSKLWTTTGGCGQWTTVLASVDPSTGTLTTYPAALNTTTNLLALCAGFASNPASNPNQLVAWTKGGFPSLVTTFDVSNGSPVQQQIQNTGARIGIFDLAVTPDGAHYLATAGSSVAQFNLSNLLQDGVLYPVGNCCTNAVVTSPAGGGMVIGGGSSAPSVSAYKLGRPGSAVTTASPGGASATVAPRGVAISPDGSSAYAITDGVSLFVIPLTPTASASSAGLGFGNQPVGSSGTGQTVSLTDNGAGTLTVSSVSMAGINPSDFLLSNDLCTGQTLAVSASCSVTVAFKPTAAGSRTASLAFSSNAVNASMVFLQGSGTPLPPGFVSTSLSGSDYGRIAVDASSGRIFVSSPSSGQITVLNSSGNLITIIPNEAGPKAMVANGGTLYVLLTFSGTVEKIDISTLADQGALATGLVSPLDLALAGGKLWTTTYICPSSNACAQLLARVDPGTVTIAYGLGGLPSTTGTIFASNPAPASNLLLIGDPPTDTVISADVTSGTALEQHRQVEPLGHLDDLAMTPDQAHFIAASENPQGLGFAYQFNEFNLSNLQTDGVNYRANSSPTAVGTSAAIGGLVVGGTNGLPTGSLDFYAYKLGQPSTLITQQNLSAPANAVPPRGMTITPDGSEALAITGGNAQPLRLTLVPIAKLPPTVPTGISAVAGVGSATVSWTPPIASGSASISSYTIRSSGGATSSVPAPATQGVIAGLDFAPHTFTVTANNTYGSSPSSANSNTVTPLPGGTYHALTPARVLDTRDGTGSVPIARVQAGGRVTVKIAGQEGVPAGHVSAVVLNVTVTNPSAASYLTVYPAGGLQPVVSNLNFVADQTVPNLVEVALGSNGSLTFFNAAGATDVIADVQGWVGDSTNSSGRDGLFNPLTPARILDTRSGNGAPQARLGPGQTLTLQVAGRGQLPALGVSGVVMNVTVTNPTTASYLTVYPAGASRPLASNLNFRAGQTVPNRISVGLGPSGQVSIFNAAGYVDVIADVNGWFTDTSSTQGGAAFVGITPVRTFDSRQGAGRLGPGELFNFTVDNSVIKHSAFVLNVTATDTTASSYVTLYPDDGSNGMGAPPNVSDLNFIAGQTVPNLTVVAVGADAQFNVYNAAGFADVILDEDGFYGPVVSAPPVLMVPSSARFDRQSAITGGPETLGRREGNWQRRFTLSKPIS